MTINVAKQIAYVPHTEPGARISKQIAYVPIYVSTTPPTSRRRQVMIGSF